MITITMMLPSHIDFAGVLVRQYADGYMVIYEGDGIVHRQILSGAQVYRKGPRLVITFPNAWGYTTYPVVVNTYNLLGELGPDVIYPTGAEIPTLPGTGPVSRNVVVWTEDFANGNPLYEASGLKTGVPDHWDRTPEPITRKSYNYGSYVHDGRGYETNSTAFDTLAAMNWYDRTHADFAAVSGANDSLIKSSNTITAPANWTGSPPEAWIVFDGSIPHTLGADIVPSVGIGAFTQFPTSGRGDGGYVSYRCNFGDGLAYLSNTWSLVSVIGKGKFAADTTNFGIRLDFYANAALSPSGGSPTESAFVLYSFAHSSVPIYQRNLTISWPLVASFRSITLSFETSSWAWPATINADGAIFLSTGYLGYGTNDYIEERIYNVKVHCGWGASEADSNTVGAVRVQPCQSMGSSLMIAQRISSNRSVNYPLLEDAAYADVVNNQLTPLTHIDDSVPGGHSAFSFAPSNYTHRSPHDGLKYYWFTMEGGNTEAILEFDLTLNADDYSGLDGINYANIIYVNSWDSLGLDMYQISGDNWEWYLTWADNNDTPSPLDPEATTPFSLSAFLGQTHHVSIHWMCSTTYTIGDYYYTNRDGFIRITIGNTSIFDAGEINLRMDWAYFYERFSEVEFEDMWPIPTGDGIVHLIGAAAPLPGVYDNFRLSYVETQ